MRILFSNEQLFDIDGVYNFENNRVWAVSRVEKNKNDRITPRMRFLQKVMVCSKGITPLVLFKESKLDHHRHTKEVLPVTLKYRNKVFGND